jgi:hypothetical protein
MRNTRKEQIISASPLSTDIFKHERHVGKVPKAEATMMFFNHWWLPVPNRMLLHARTITNRDPAYSLVFLLRCA